MESENKKTLKHNEKADFLSSFGDLKALLAYLLENSTKSLSRTEIMKYVYTFEYYFAQMYGEQLTNLKFNRYYYGPNETLVLDAVLDLQTEGIVDISEYQNYYGSLSYSHKFINDSGNCSYELPEQAKFVASFILDKLGNESYQGVIDFAYSTPPMAEVLKEERSVGGIFLGRVLDMSKTGPIFKSTRAQKEEARKRIQSQPQERGSDEEYYSHLLTQYDSFEDTRRRAISVESNLPEQERIF